MRRHDRRGMELAVNTLVVLILGIVIMGGGIALVYKIFYAVKDTPEEVSRMQQDQLFSILLSGKNKIAVLNNVMHASRKETASFAVAIQNQLPCTDATFKPTKAVFSTPPYPLVVAPNGCVATPSDAKCPKMKLIDLPFKTARYKSKAFYVQVDVPAGADAGEYVFNVDVNVQSGTNCVPVLTPGLYARTTVNVIVQ